MSLFKVKLIALGRAHPKEYFLREIEISESIFSYFVRNF
jgi:hypothetical protein